MKDHLSTDYVRMKKRCIEYTIEIEKYIKLSKYIDAGYYFKLLKYVFDTKYSEQNLQLNSLSARLIVKVQL